MEITSLKADHFFLLSQSKIRKQKRSGLLVHTITNNAQFEEDKCVNNKKRKIFLVHFCPKCNFLENSQKYLKLSTIWSSWLWWTTNSEVNLQQQMITNQLNSYTIFNSSKVIPSTLTKFIFLSLFNRFLSFSKNKEDFLMLPISKPFQLLLKRYTGSY